MIEDNPRKAAAEGRSAPFRGGYRGNNYNRGGGQRTGKPGGGFNNKNGPEYDGYATAPYNFVPYDKGHIVPAVERGGKLYSGVIRCTLTNLTPLLVAGPGADDKKGREDSPVLREFFRVGGKPVIPGTSLKGMLRSYLEILSCSCLAPVSAEKIFWRDVASRNSSAYKDRFGDQQAPIQGGFLSKKGAEYSLTEATVTRNNKLYDGQFNRAKKYDKDNLYTGVMNNPKSRDRIMRGYKFERKPGAKAETLEDYVWHDFIQQMTEDQKNRWKLEEEKMTSNPETTGARVFFTRGKDGKINAIGTARYFRIGYDRLVSDFSGQKKTPDFAEGLFGSVRGEAQRGRVQVSAAHFSGTPAFEEHTYVQGTPHPSALRHYLKQDENRLGKRSRILQDELSNYNNGGAELRGHKMYWHRHVEEDTKNPNVKVQSTLKAMKPNAEAVFEIRVDRISPEELGGLLKVLSLDKGHAHKLGAGKAQGLGSVRITVKDEDLRVQEAHSLYVSLKARLSNDEQEPGVLSGEEKQECIRAFEDYVRKHTDKRHYDNVLQAFDQLTDFDPGRRPSDADTATMPLTKKDGEPNFAWTKAILASVFKVKGSGPKDRHR